MAEIGCHYFPKKSLQQCSDLERSRAQMGKGQVFVTHWPFLELFLKLI